MVYYRIFPTASRILPLIGLVLFSIFFTNQAIQAAGNSLPPAIDKALSEAEAYKKLHLKYTMTFQWPNQPTIVTRYNAKNKSWTLISGNPDELSSKALKKFKKMKRIESVPGGLTYDDYRNGIKQAKQIEENDENLIFAFTSPQTPKDLEKNEGIIRARIIVNRQDGGMREYSIQSEKPFNPRTGVRMDEFIFEHHFERVFDDLPPLLVKAHCKAIGKQFVSKVDMEYTLLFSDFEKLP